MPVAAVDVVAAGNDGRSGAACLTGLTTPVG